jgi:hypothetical protein
LIKESRKEDPTGMLELTIKNNKIKWSWLKWIITKQKIT